MGCEMISRFRLCDSAHLRNGAWMLLSFAQPLSIDSRCVFLHPRRHCNTSRDCRNHSYSLRFLRHEIGSDRVCMCARVPHYHSKRLEGMCISRCLHTGTMHLLKERAEHRSTQNHYLLCCIASVCLDSFVEGIV